MSEAAQDSPWESFDPYGPGVVDPFAAPGIAAPGGPPAHQAAPNHVAPRAPLYQAPPPRSDFQPQVAAEARFVDGSMARRQPMVPVATPQAAMGDPEAEIGGHLLGVSTVLVGIGSLLGVRFGGLYGGVAGALFGGAAVNAYRAVSHAFHGTSESRKEALVSGTYALVAGGLGGYVAWKVDRKKATKNPRRATRNQARNCGFRPV